MSCINDMRPVCRVMFVEPFSAVNRPKTAGTSPVNDRRFDLEGKQFGLSTNDYCSLYCICSTVANVQEQILIVKDLVKAS